MLNNSKNVGMLNNSKNGGMLNNSKNVGMLNNSKNVGMLNNSKNVVYLNITAKILFKKFLQMAFSNYKLWQPLQMNVYNCNISKRQLICLLLMTLQHP
jgi:hypothetical protein